VSSLDFDFDNDLAKFTPRQKQAIAALDNPLFKYLLYGGALGGGKSYLLRWAAARTLMVASSEFGVKAPVGMLACEDYPALKDRQLQKITTEFPPWMGKLHNDHKAYGRCYILNKKLGGGVIALRNLDDTSKYQSAEFIFIFVDELTKNIYEVFTFLRTRLRYPGVPDSFLKFLGGTNPGGVGHGWCKAFWIDRIFSDDWAGFEQKFAYIPSKATDNPHLPQEYYQVLNTLHPDLREAFKEGNWDVYVGQAFTEYRDRYPYVLPNDTPIPVGAPLYMTFDWGFGKPFSIGWWYVTNDGIIRRFDEWYGWNGTPNMGLKLTDSDIARGIIEREELFHKMYGIGRDYIRITGNDSFNKKPDYKGGGQGKSTSEVFAEDPFNLYLTPGDSLRTLKIRQFRERLKIREINGGEAPMIQVYERCKQFRRTIPNLVMETRTLEDIDSDGEDHVYDDSCFLCMARVIEPAPITKKVSETEKRINDLEKGVQVDSIATYENEMANSPENEIWNQ